MSSCRTSHSTKDTPNLLCEVWYVGNCSRCGWELRCLRCMSVQESSDVQWWLLARLFRVAGFQVVVGLKNSGGTDFTAENFPLSLRKQSKLGWHSWRRTRKLQNIGGPIKQTSLTNCLQGEPTELLTELQQTEQIPTNFHTRPHHDEHQQQHCQDRH